MEGQAGGMRSQSGVPAPRWSRWRHWGVTERPLGYLTPTPPPATTRWRGAPPPSWESVGTNGPAPTPLVPFLYLQKSVVLLTYAPPSLSPQGGGRENHCLLKRWRLLKYLPIYSSKRACLRARLGGGAGLVRDENTRG